MLKNRDFWGGVMLIIIGIGAVFIAKDYRFGSVRHMGPGFFPTVLGVILILFGLTIMLKGLIKEEKILSNLSLRALGLLPISLVFFGILIERAGLIPALVALIFCSASASKEFRFWEVCLLTIVLTVLSVSLFIWGLGLPFPLVKGF